ncbi:MFS transporter, partial [Fangia hongkongensis]
ILMACVPTYSSIGILCLFILLFVRMLQSFSIGAEYSLSFVIMYDHASSDKKYFIPSLINAALAIGVLAATLLIYYLSYMGVITPTSNAWRYIFLFSACMFFASWVFRVKAYDRTQVTKHNPNISLFRVLQSEKYTVIATVAYISFSAVGFYMFSVMSSTTLNSLGYSPLNSLMISSIGVLATIIFIPFWGKIHDLGNPFKLQLYGIVLLFAFSFLHTYLMYLKNYPLIFLGQFIFGAILSINMAALPSYLSKIFAINNRSYLLGFTYNIALVIFGATTPVVIVALSGLSQYMHIIYFGVICIISALGICKLEGGLEIKDISSNRSNHIQPI